MPAKKYSTARSLAPLIILVLVILITFLYLSFKQSAVIKTTTNWVVHTEEVLICATQIFSTVSDNETGSRGFLITGQQSFLEPLMSSKEIINNQIDTLRSLTKDNRSQQLNIDTLSINIYQRMIFSDSTVKVRIEKGLQDAIQMVSTGRGKMYMDNIRKLTARIKTTEINLLRDRKAASEKAIAVLNRISSTVIIISILMILVLVTKLVKSSLALKKSEISIKKNDELFRLLTANVKDYAIFMLDTAGRVESWNAGAEHIKGYKAEEIIGKSLEIFYTEKALKNGEPFHNLQMADQYGHFEQEGWRLRKDGTKFWANVVFTALKDKRGVLNGYSKITRDITERKKAQEELEFLSLQIKQSNDAIYNVDADLKIKSWNQGAEKMYGYTREEAWGKNPDDLLKTALSNTAINNAINVMAKQDYWKGELKRQTKSGKDIWVRSSSTVVKDAQENVTGYIAVSFDVTNEKKIWEEVNYLASIVEQSSEAILSRGVEDRQFITWNKGAENLFGYTAKEAIGRTAGELGLTQLSNEEIVALEKQLSETGSWQAEMNYFHKNGTSFFGAATGNLIRNETGHPASLNFIIKDISVRKKLEEQLKKSNEELEAFSYSVSHDLRAPLRAIIGYTTILEEDYSSKLDEEAKRITSVIKRNTIKMGNLIDDLLTFSRMGRQDLLKNNINSGEMVKAIAAELNVKSTGMSAVEWIIHPLPDIKADMNTIRQVWINLLSNAVKYSSKTHKPCIEIGSFEENKQMVFYVKDNGVGFDDKYKHKLFKVFQRLHGPEEFEGTGIGLAIVEKVISKHGGRTWANGEHNKGATFFFSLPNDDI